MQLIIWVVLLREFVLDKAGVELIGAELLLAEMFLPLA